VNTAQFEPHFRQKQTGTKVQMSIDLLL